MHKFLRAVGFSCVDKRRELEEILDDVICSYDEKIVAESNQECLFAEFSKNYGYDCGITVCGEYDEDNQFHIAYYFPFFRGTGITTQEHLVIEQHASKRSYAGICDDIRIGVTLIFYIQNAGEYLTNKRRKDILSENLPVSLSGLASEGKILLPVQKNKEQVRIEKEATQNRNHLIAEARKGDEEAMENLTIDDIDTYSMISKRIETEDIFTIVDSYFMPYGIECDQYNIMGEITDYMDFQNTLTGDTVCHLTVECNDLQFDICINKKDLLGEPEKGRRFKGIIWLQGEIYF
ncbi:MAG: DUF3881 family protein [Lachnospiraceae bacterium]|nr:DUF3881 family protein [Lachnospiraceae bacterium]